MIKLEGIVLKQIPFKETDRIVTLYSKEQGVLQFIVKRLSQKNLQKVNLVSPLCYGEYHLRGKEQSLLQLIDGSIYNLHLPIRENSKRLQASMKILQLLLSTQVQNKPSALLFQLVKSYLSQMTKTPHVEELLLSFHLKLLKHEGLIGNLFHCSKCKEEKKHFFLEGGFYCANCHPSSSHPLTHEQWISLVNALFIKDFSDLPQILASEIDMKKTIDLLNYF